MTAPNYEKHQEEDARLIVLRELARASAGRLPVSVLAQTLDDYGHRRTEDWVQSQVRHVADVGGVSVLTVGVSLIAEITRTGLDHVARRTQLPGIRKPLPGEE